ncbi:MAG: DUF2096 family protein [Candidatus Bathyarchaeia archaeon]
MNWEARWRILSDVITDLRGGGEIVPPKIINDLRSAKVMLEIIKVNSSHPENISRLEECLSNVETYVLSVAKSKFGEEYVNNILRRLCELEVERAEFEIQVRFHPNLPRGEKWVRIQPTGAVTFKDIEESAKRFGLKFRVERDGYVLVYGEDEKLKSFVKRLAEIFRGLKRGNNLS